MIDVGFPSTHLPGTFLSRVGNLMRKKRAKTRKRAETLRRVMPSWRHWMTARSTADVALMEARIAAASGNLCGAKKLYRRALELYDELPGSNESRVLDAEEELEDVLLRMYRPDQRKYGRSRRTRNRITSDRSNGSTTASLSGSIHGSMWSESDIDIASLP